MKGMQGPLKALRSKSPRGRLLQGVTHDGEHGGNSTKMQCINGAADMRVGALRWIGGPLRLSQPSTGATISRLCPPCARPGPLLPGGSQVCHVRHVRSVPALLLLGQWPGSSSQDHCIALSRCAAPPLARSARSAYYYDI